MSNLQKKVEKYLETKKEKDFKNILKEMEKKFDYATSRWNGEEKKDMKQEIHTTLWKALSAYDISKNTQFNTFFWTCWHNRKGEIEIRENAQKRIKQKDIMSLNVKVDDETETEHIEMVEDMGAKKRYEIVMNRADFYIFVEENIKNQKDKNVILSFYENGSIVEVAHELGCSTANVCMKLKKMSKRPYASALYQFLKEC